MHEKWAICRIYLRLLGLHHDKVSPHAQLQFKGLETNQATIKWSIPPQFSSFFLLLSFDQRQDKNNNSNKIKYD